MAIEDRDRYYALDGDKDLDGSEANYETAENIDAVLRDMTDIYQNAPAADIGKAVVLDEVETEDEQTIRRFKLKEVSKPISAQLKEIIVGNGNNWAMGNGYTYKIDYIWTDASTVTTGGPSNFAIAHYVQTMPSTFGVMTEVMNPSTSQSFSPPRYVLKSGFTTRDTAKEKIAGTAQINIGEDNTDYTSDNRKFWSKDLTGPRIDIGGTAVIEMEGTGYSTSNSETPVVSMRGKCLVDMCGSKDMGYSVPGYGRNRTASYWPNVLTNCPNPFNSSQEMKYSNVTFPYLHMHDSSTILMEGAPILNMRGNSLLSINGDVCIDINGRNPVGRPSMPSAAAGYGDVAIDIRPGTAIQIGTGNESTQSNPTTSMIRLNRQQLVVACALPKETNVSSSSCISQLYMDTSNGYVTSYESELFPFKNASNSGEYGLFNFFGGPMAKWDPSTMNSRIGQWASTGVWGDGPGKNSGPVVWMQGKSRIKIGDSGTFSAALGGLGNVSISMEPHYGASTEIYMASASYSADVINIANESNSFTTFHHGAGANAATKYEFTPHGNTLVRFSPRVKFFSNIDCANTEMLFQWSGMYGFFQGNNNYALLDGAQTHLENVGNTFIMRDDTTSEVYAEREGQDLNTTIYAFRKNYQPTATKNVIVDSLPTNETDFASTTLAQDAMTAFNNNKSSLPDSSNIHGAVSEFFATDNYGSRNDPQYYNPYRETCCRYWTEDYPIEASLYVGYSDTAAVQFDSTTAFTGTQDTTAWKYLSTSSYYTAILSNADFLAAVRTQLGDLAQYFYSVPYNSIYYKRSATANGYHYMICYCYVRLRQTFTRDEFFHNSSAGPSPVTSGTIINSNYAIYSKVTAAYASGNIPTGWSLTTSTGSSYGDNRIHLYSDSTPIGENKWNRGARVRYSTDPQDNVAWSQPVQTGESGDTKTILQMYNRANLMMRADTINKPYCNEYVQRPCTDVYEYTFTPSETYTVPTDSTYQFTSTTSYSTSTTESGINLFIKGGSYGTATDYKDFVEYVKTTEHDGVWGVIGIEKTNSSSPYAYTVTYKKLSQKAAIGTQLKTFINGADYAAFTAYLTTTYPDKELWRIVDIVSGTGGDLVIRFTLKDASYTEYIKTPATDDPVLEMVGRSELRMYGGAYIKGETKYGETTFTFGSTTSDEPPVSFTLAQLAAAISGGGAQLPDAANEEF